ncbi:hypothetical protein ACFWUZ_34200 [Streptomyces sp. NPDC058646]|uniref:hypothetical protein n=1 Tax=Streptomyces sp. NPDC058646 TaxID=3346574 RepID=UPI00365632B3
MLTAAARGLRTPYAAWVLADALDVVCTQPELTSRLGNRTVKDLAALAEDALAGDADSALAQPAIAGLLRLAAAGHHPPHRLLALLADITGTEPVDALERLPILIGTTHAHFPTTDTLLDVLSTLERQTNLTPQARADATFELALADLRAALDAPERAAAHELLRVALMRFTGLQREHEARLDAAAYAAALQAVLAFATLEDNPSTKAVQDEIEDAAQRLDAATANLAAWTSGMHQLDWLTARGQTQAAWSHLVTTLRTAQAHLDLPSWYTPASALTDLLQVYQASRSIRASQPSGLTSVISPTIEASFAKQEGLLQHLEQALAQDPQFTAHPDAEALHTAVRTRRMQDNRKQPPEGMPGKQLQGRPALAALFHADTAGLRDDIDPHLLDQLEDRLQYVAKGYTPTGNTRFDEHLESLLDVLATSPAWRPTDSHYATDLLQHFLRFLYDRFDAQANLYGDRTAYLGPPIKDKNGKVTPWAEKHLQDDFHQHLTGICTPGTVQREMWDVAGGRADVIYTPAPGSRLVTEVKWRDKTWTRPRIEQDYLAQAAVYTATGPPFSFLLVGDATGNPGGHPSIEDNLWVVSHARTTTEIPRLVVTGVLPTARPTPSATRTPRAAQTPSP